MSKLRNMTNKPKVKAQKPVPVKIVNDAPKSYADEDKKWRAQDDLRILQNAEKIKSDKERMKAAKSCAKEQMNDLKKLC